MLDGSVSSLEIIRESIRTDGIASSFPAETNKPNVPSLVCLKTLLFNLILTSVSPKELFLL
jgi:hypothetical protein